MPAGRPRRGRPRTHRQRPVRDRAGRPHRPRDPRRARGRRPAAVPRRPDLAGRPARPGRPAARPARPRRGFPAHRRRGRHRPARAGPARLPPRRTARHRRRRPGRHRGGRELAAGRAARPRRPALAAAARRRTLVRRARRGRPGPDGRRPDRRLPRRTRPRRPPVARTAGRPAPHPPHRARPRPGRCARLPARQRPALAAAGHGVLLPAWWQRRPRLGLAATAHAAPAPGSVQRAAQADRDTVLDFRWQLAVGEQPLTRQELEELAAAQSGLVRFRGRWIEVDAGQLAAALRFLADRRDDPRLDAAALLRLAATDGAVVDGLPVTAVHAEGPLGDLLAGRLGRLPGAHRTPPPPGFTGALRPYQERGLAWLDALGRLGLGAVLADDMGLGKTVQTLALLALEHARGARGPVLLVCPTSLVGNWQREAARFTPGCASSSTTAPTAPAPTPPPTW
ncbi:SNF2 helicase-associated domain-containing protein [Kitasatospora saccharophila]|uniref:SNF2 helicase-associated domain-containing protein n=1 Tax=Kitasatospora saccharophila TaxID=407973 RepID=UPI00363A8576